MKIPFNKPAVIGNEANYIMDVLQEHKLSGDGKYNHLCSSWIEKKTKCPRVLLTPSGTHALEIAALLFDIQPGDEVILPSYTFTSTANAFALRGARLVFVDIRPDTMNINEKLIEAAITPKTKLIVPVHYAGVACEMDTICRIAKEYNLGIIEDAAQGYDSKYDNKYLGTIGDIGCYSFHETKNISCGEGGAILINNPSLIKKAEIIREKGTNREEFFRGEIDKYTWIDIGSSLLLNELSAAFLYGQLQNEQKILEDRMRQWKFYHSCLYELEQKNKITLPFIPSNCTHNAHMFYIKTETPSVRNKLLDYLNKNSIHGVFHYIPLHTSPAGRRFGFFSGKDKYTTLESQKLLRLPLYYSLNQQNQSFVCKITQEFFKR